MPPELTNMTFEGADFYNKFFNKQVKTKGPRVLVAKFTSKPSLEVYWVLSYSMETHSNKLN